MEKFIWIKCLTLKIFINVTEYNIGNGPIRRQMSTSIKGILEHFSLYVYIVCYISYNLREICKSRKMRKLFLWTWTSRSMSRITGLLTFDWKCQNSCRCFSFRIFATCQHTFTQKVTDTVIYTQTGVMTIGKICKSDLLKKQSLTHLSFDFFSLFCDIPFWRKQLFKEYVWVDI